MITNEIFVKLGVLKLKHIIVYKIYLLAFKAFNNMLLLTLNIFSLIKSGLYSMKYTNKCVRIICISNIRSLNCIIIALSSWNKLSNHVKLISSHTSFKDCF